MIFPTTEIIFVDGEVEVQTKMLFLFHDLHLCHHVLTAF